MPRTRPRSNSLPDHSFPGVYNDSMGGNIDYSRIRYASVYPRSRIDSRRRAGFEYLLFRVVPGGVTIFRSVYLCRGGQRQRSHILFHAEKSHNRHSFGVHSAADPLDRCKRRIPGGTDFQLHSFNRVLCYHVF